jgi:DNA-binding CsgD family transcriptional regulator
MSQSTIPDPGSFVVPRTTELGQLTDAIGRGRSVLVLGDAGVGKTHLAGAALASLDKALPGFATLTVHASPAADLSSSLEPGLAGSAPEASTARVVSDVLAALERRSRGGQVVLRVEDAHLLAPRSAQALAWLVSQGDIQLVATMRATAASESPWYGLWKNDTVERIDLRSFTEPQVRDFLLAELGGSITADTVWRLWRASAGNAFHLRELVRSQLGRGTLVLRDGVWVWDGRGEPDDRLRDVVRHEWDALDDGARSALATLALAGPLRASVLRDHADADAVRVLDRRGLTTTAPDPHASSTRELLVDVVQERFGQAVLELVPHQQRRELLMALGPGTDATEAALVRRVLHSLDCGLSVDLASVDVAARAAVQAYDGATTRRIVDLTLSTARPPASFAAVLLMYRSQAWRIMRDLVRARDDLTLATATLLDEGPGDDSPLDDDLVARLLSVAEQQAAIHQFDENDYEASQRVIDDLVPRILARVPAERRERWQYVVHVSTLRRQGYAGLHAQVGETSRRILEHPASPGAVIGLVSPTALGLAFMGDAPQAVAMCERYLDVARVHDAAYRWVRVEIASAQYVANMLHGTPAQATESFGQDTETAAMDRTNVHLARGLTAIAQGSWSAACVELRAALVTYSVVDFTGVTAFARYALALALAASGDAVASRDMLDKAVAQPLRASVVVYPFLQLMHLESLLWSRSPDLERAALALAQDARAHGYDQIELEALHRTLDRGGRRSVARPEVLARLAELTARVAGPRAAAIARHVEAVVSGDTTLIHLAERTLGERGLWLPPLTESAVAQLTRREREFAALAASGMTSRVIADRLVLSVRTVDSHLSRVFSKTGVHSREELARVLR